MIEALAFHVVATELILSGYAVATQWLLIAHLVDFFLYRRNLHAADS